jgi:hypothetical protein
MINAPIGDQLHWIVIELAVLIGMVFGWFFVWCNYKEKR